MGNAAFDTVRSICMRAFYNSEDDIPILSNHVKICIYTRVYIHQRKFK